MWSRSGPVPGFGGRPELLALAGVEPVELQEQMIPDLVAVSVDPEVICSFRPTVDQLWDLGQVSETSSVSVYSFVTRR